MTPSLLLTTLAPTPDTTHLNVDKRDIAVPFGIITAHADTCPGPTPNDARPAPSTRTLARPWTGTPIRAIVPLPRRKRVLPNANAPTLSTRENDTDDVPSIFTSTTHPDRPIPILNDDDAECTDSGEDEDEDGDGEEGSDEDCGTPSGSRYCSYESITAVGGLSGWSFEELRVECYAQSLIARGTKPPPVIQPSLAIPPAFVPRIVPRS